MATRMIRNLDVVLKELVRTARRGHSMEAEVRDIQRETLKEPGRPEINLYQRIRSRFASLGGVDLDLPPKRRPSRRASTECSCSTPTSCPPS
jgi:antitoxin FitA